jgi:hypothetical protein
VNCRAVGLLAAKMAMKVVRLKSAVDHVADEAQIPFAKANTQSVVETGDAPSYPCGVTR